MPNWCTNSLRVTGPKEDVLRFVADATSDKTIEWAPDEIIGVEMAGMVRAGSSYETALATILRRASELNAGSRFSIDSGDPLRGFPELQNAVRAGDVEKAETIYWEALQFEKEGSQGDRKATHLNLAALIPPPPEVLAMGYRVAGYNWQCNNWGTKWGIDAEAPEVYVCKDDMAEARYQYFSSAWSPPLEAVRRMSENYPTLHFSLAYSEEGNAVFGADLCHQGEVLASEARSDVSDFREESDDPDYPDDGYLDEGALMADMMDTADMHADYNPPKRVRPLSMDGQPAPKPETEP